MKSRSFLLNSLINLIGLVVPLVISLYYVPVMIHAMGGAGYGLYSLITMIITYLAFLEFGIGRAAAKYISEAQRRTQEPEIVSQALMLTGGFGLLGGLVAAAISPLIARWFGGNSPLLQREFLYALLMLAVVVPAMLVESVFRSLLEVRGEFFYLNVIRISIAVLGAAAVVLMAHHGYRAVNEYFFLQVLIRLLGVGVHAGLWFRRARIRLHWAWHPEVTRLLVVFGGWTSVSGIVGPLMVNFDRFWVAYYFSPEQVAYYSVPFDVVTKLWLIPTALVTVLFPGLARLDFSDRAHIDGLVQRAALLVTVLLLPATIVAIFFCDSLLEWWLGASFAGRSAVIMVIMSFGVLTNSPSQVTHVALLAAGRARLLALLHLLQLPFYFLLLVILSMRLGLVGVAWTWVIRALVDAFLLGLAYSRIVSGNYLLVRNLLLFNILGLLLLLLRVYLGSVALLWVGGALFAVTSAVGLRLVWLRYREERREIRLEAEQG